jgi:hypothetical protein
MKGRVQTHSNTAYAENIIDEPPPVLVETLMCPGLPGVVMVGFMPRAVGWVVASHTRSGSGAAYLSGSVNLTPLPGLTYSVHIDPSQ